MRIGAAGALRLLEEANGRGRVIVGACTLAEEPGAIVGWRWDCGCGAGGGWIGNAYAVMLVVATFLNRHSLCSLVIERFDQADTSPVDAAAAQM